MAISYNAGSPGITIQEEDLATFVNPASVTNGAIVGNFQWGPCDTTTIISNEDELITYFGKPNDINYKDWFCARNFLNYSKNLWTARTVNSATLNAADVPADAIQIKNESDFTAQIGTLSASDKTAKVYARYPGIFGNKLRVVISDKATLEDEGSILAPYINQILKADDVAVGVFIDGKLVEMNVYSFNKTAKDINGNTNYIVNAVNKYSEYIYVIESKLITYSSEVRSVVNIDTTLTGGTYTTPVAADYIATWNLFKDDDTINVSLLMQGGADATVGKHILDNVAGSRKDSIACVSPQQESCVNIASSTAVTNITSESATMGYTSYRFMDGNYKYQYDAYNDVYRWIPLNGDIAGIFAEVDAESAPWYSPGNHVVKDCVKLAFYPNKAQRDELYKYRVNPVTSFADTGTVLFGDWTGAEVNSSFNFVNVRRLFIYMEKSISQYAKSVMWKQNDEITQSIFYQAVDPFLRGIKGDRGIQDYKIICDSTVNTTEVVNAGTFVAKIFVKPIYSVRWVKITFVSTRSDVNFEELSES